MTTLKELKEKLMQDETFAKEYERAKPLYEIKRAVIEKRIKSKLTQKQIAESMRVSQSVVARFEKGNDFKFSTLQNYARAVGLKKLVIEF